MRFVLVHGAYHGGWCWDRLVPELEGRGHGALAVDLPIGDPAAGAGRYADAVAEAIRAADLGGDSGLVVVAHSLSGLMLPLVPERCRISMMVFLCAFIPQPGLSFNQQRQAEKIEPEVELTDPGFDDLGNGVWMIDLATATQLFFHDAPPGLAGWAGERLRPQAHHIMDEPTPLASWPDVPSASILCRDDHAVDADWARRAARERLGVEAVEMEGGHSPFLTRPAELATILDELVRQQPRTQPGAPWQDHA